MAAGIGRNHKILCIRRIQLIQLKWGIHGMKPIQKFNLKLQIVCLLTALARDTRNKISGLMIRLFYLLRLIDRFSSYFYFGSCVTNPGAGDW